ncbi:hypothetical protein LTS08_004884 [Lithohypha guttulata]|nr:hypothetical protein LTS08_004884 [Lithohypha guttulata]
MVNQAPAVQPSSLTNNKQLRTPPSEPMDESTSKMDKPQAIEPLPTASSTDKSDVKQTQDEAKIKSKDENKREAKDQASQTTDSRDEAEKSTAADSPESKEKPKDKDDDKTKDDAKTYAKDDKKDEEKDDKKDEEKDKKKSLPRGMKADTKLLWAKTDAQFWQDKDPDDGKNVEESDECLQHAIVVRKKRVHEGNRKPLKVDSIVVHSPLVKKALQGVFTGYPDLVIDLEELVFDAPFAPFFHRWAQFEKAFKEETDEMTKSHMKLLYDALDSELAKPIQRHNDLVRHKAIDFELLWTLFSPGTLMYSHDNGHDRLYETCDCEYYADLGGMKFIIRCNEINWDGEKFGKVMLSEEISKFKGTRQITTLPSYPLRFHAKSEQLKTKCIERGRRFQALAGVYCKDYKGTAVEYTKYAYQSVKTKRQLEGRIMLDEELFAKFNPDESRSMRELEDDDEDVKQAEAEASARLIEQAEKAKEALKKVEEEEKKKQQEEEAKKQKETDGKSETATKSEAESESKEKTQEAAADASQSEPDKAKSEVSSDEVKVEVPVKSTKSSTTDGADVVQASADIKKEAEASTTSTDSEGAPTPTESVDEPKAFSNTEKQELKDDQLVICNSWLRGYSLSHQKWCSFSVDHISDVSWNDNAFASLSLPCEYRELILATIQSQIRQNQWKQKMEQVGKEQKPLSALYEKTEDATDEEDDNPAEFDDFIAQKGRGYIMLFSGNPGVGKTATAESIAELLHVPLCIISVGNLGTTAESVESALQDILELASKRNAVLLLDEADIFLEQRTRHDLHRNAVVSVFLRLLEYYQGVLCLTTNRSEEIDVAFHSRIHISLPFPDLTEGNREQIWRHFANITNAKHEAGAMRRKVAADEKKNKNTTTTTTATTDTNLPTPAPEDSTTLTNGTKTPTSPSSPNPPPSEHLTHHSHDATTDTLIDISPTNFRKLSQTQLNGRQIKNAFKTAVLLASYKKEKVQMKHVKTALKTIDGNGLGKREVGGMYY